MISSNSIIQPLSDDLKQQVVEETKRYIRLAEQLFDIKMKPVEIVFNLKGRAAGMYRVSQRDLRKLSLHRNRYREIRYNPYIFARYYEDNLNVTVPHEVAHFVTDIIHGLKNIKPHGKEWKQVMATFGADASVTADYDLTGIPKKKMRSFTYRCLCGDRQLSAIRHNKIIKRQYRYHCKICKQTLQLKDGNVNQGRR
jgi:SprT protein